MTVKEVRLGDDARMPGQKVIAEGRPTVAATVDAG